MIVLSTEGSVSVGSHLAERLLKLGEHVTLSDRRFGSNALAPAVPGSFWGLDRVD